MEGIFAVLYEEQHYIIVQYILFHATQRWLWKTFLLFYKRIDIIYHFSIFFISQRFTQIMQVLFCRSIRGSILYSSSVLSLSQQRRLWKAFLPFHTRINIILLFGTFFFMLLSLGYGRHFCCSIRGSIYSSSVLSLSS